LLGEDEDGLITDGATDEFPGFGCAIYSAFADTFWAAAAVSAAVVTARLSGGAVKLPLCLASEAAPKAAAAFFLRSSFLDA
jgi:hypothetical protein